MADPTELLIFQNVLAVLKTITVANSYHSEVGTDSVEEGIKLWGEVNRDLMPYLGAALVGIVDKERPGKTLHPTIRLILVGHVSSTTPTTDALKLHDDVIAALYLDHKRGGVAPNFNAINTRWIDTIMDFRDPQNANTALIEMHFDIKYQRGIVGS